MAPIMMTTHKTSIVRTPEHTKQDEPTLLQDLITLESSHHYLENHRYEAKEKTGHIKQSQSNEASA
jgi:hypothetical protein